MAGLDSQDNRIEMSAATVASGVAPSVRTPPTESPPTLTLNPLQLVVSDRDPMPLEVIALGEPENADGRTKVTMGLQTLKPIVHQVSSRRGISRREKQA